MRNALAEYKRWLIISLFRKKKDKLEIAKKRTKRNLQNLWNFIVENTRVFNILLTNVNFKMYEGWIEER